MGLLFSLYNSGPEIEDNSLSKNPQTSQPIATGSNTLKTTITGSGGRSVDPGSSRYQSAQSLRAFAPFDETNTTRVIKQNENLILNYSSISTYSEKTKIQDAIKKKVYNSHSAVKQDPRVLINSGESLERNHAPTTMNTVSKINRKLDSTLFTKSVSNSNPQLISKNIAQQLDNKVKPNEKILSKSISTHNKYASAFLVLSNNITQPKKPINVDYSKVLVNPSSSASNLAKQAPIKIPYKPIQKADPIPVIASTNPAEKSNSRPTPIYIKQSTSKTRSNTLNLITKNPINIESNPHKSKDYFYICQECCYRWQVTSFEPPNEKLCENKKCGVMVKAILGPLVDTKKFGYYYCWKCTRKWPSAYSWFFYPQKCKSCHSDVFAYKREDIDRAKHGYYECVCGEFWESDNCNFKLPQQCSCGKAVFPTRQIMSDPAKPHLRDLCGKCIKLGRSCWNEPDEVFKIENYGYYRCECGKMWESQNSSEEFSEKCECGKHLYPYIIEEFSECNINFNHAHPEELCKKCVSLGKSCYKDNTNYIKFIKESWDRFRMKNGDFSGNYYYEDDYYSSEN